MTQELKTPYADLLPPLTSDEFAALKADIKANGVRDPVLIDDEDDNLDWDGHNRYRIDKSAPTTTLRGLAPGEKEAFVYKSNLSRRNLSPEQKTGCHSANEGAGREASR